MATFRSLESAFIAVEAVEQATLCECLALVYGDGGERRYLGGTKPRIKEYD